jgi:hypothetical protein
MKSQDQFRRSLHIQRIARMTCSIMVDRPIFIFGSPGSGTTLLYEALCNHKDLAYITLNMLRAGIHRHSPLIATTLLKWHRFKHKDTASIAPHEANSFWVKYFGIYEYLTENDYLPEMSDYYKKNITLVQKISKRSRFMNKNLEHCGRVRLLDRIFPDAKFIHIIRDGRAVAFSIHNKKEHGVSPTMFLLSLEKILGKKYQPERSKLFNYALGWGELVKKAREARTFGSNRYYEVRYEDLIERPQLEIKKIVEFCELDWYDEFEKGIPHTTNMNVKWMKDATPEERKDLEESTAEIRGILGIV